jgi:hypothetical protein
VLGFIGLGRRGLRRTAWVLLLIPLHWLLLSLAAWRAVWQLVRAPQLWEKTEHGLAIRGGWKPRRRRSVRSSGISRSCRRRGRCRRVGGDRS